MINSMTGYGNADGRLSGTTYIVEISTVNNRYFKPTIRLPETLGFLESDVEKELRGRCRAARPTIHSGKKARRQRRVSK